MPSRKTLIQLGALLLLTVFFLMATAHAGTTGDEFKDTYDLVMGWAKGYLGKIFAVAAFLIGAGFSAARQNPMPAIFGLVLALIIGFGPALLEKILTATI
jgi:conjugal transfer pilus assembly protein TraA